MKTDYRQDTARGGRKGVLTALFGLALLALSGCEEPDASDGTVINSLLLPTDVVLNLFCEDAGINDEQCVLDDPENPFVFTTILETDQIDDDDPNPPPSKFDLADSLPQDSSGAKARFCLWATALARRQSGENQWRTALALHELFSANSNLVFQDELIREQALKAYRSVLDNFFGSVTFFRIGGALLPFQLKEVVARDLFYTEETGFTRLIDTQLEVLEVLGEWGYTYDPLIDLLQRNE